jgi:RNA polymerase sigma-70 factor (ECF subfamily)
MESDRQAGVRHRPMQVTASRRLTIIEDDLLNPPWNPDHCPPGVVWLLSLRDNQIQHIRLFHPRSAPVATP